MSMRALTKLIRTRVETSEAKNRKRLYVHDERRDAAQALSRSQYARMLKSKALEAAARPSSHPLVTLTPEMAMVIAQHLQKANQ